MTVRYREWSPPPPLRRWVRCLWLLEHPAGAHATERVLPDGSVELVLHYGDRFLQRLEDGSSLVQPRSLFVGGQRRFVLIEPTGRAGMIGVRFAPGAASRFVGMPLDRLGPAPVDATELWGPAARILEARVAEASDDATRRTLVETFLMARCDDAALTFVDAAVGAITASRGRARVGDLARAACVSRRTLERHFGARVGLSPKALCRIVRLHEVLRSLSEPSPVRSWAEVAAAVGFADQAHLSRDFREIAGLPPDAFRREPNDYTHLFVSST